MTDLHFSTATSDDVPLIVKINNSHVGSQEPGGFLVIHLTEAEVHRLIVTREAQFFIAKDETEGLLGYVEVLDKMDMSLLDNMTWDSDATQSLAETVLSSKYVYVKQLAVRKGFQRGGIATFLYQELEKHVQCPIVVFAASRPRLNLPSIRFHEGAGYTRTATLKRTDFGGHADYESIFYVKTVYRW